MSRFLALINAAAGELKLGSPAEQAEQLLRQTPHKPEIHFATTTSEIKQFAALVRQQSPEVVMVASGDTTVATLWKELADEKTCYALLPTGSFNNISRSLGIHSMEEGVEALSRGKLARFDVGVSQDEMFFEGAGFGLMAQIFSGPEKTDYLALVKHALVTLKSLDNISCKISVDGKCREIETSWLTIANTGRLGALEVCDFSSPIDGSMEIVFAHSESAEQLLHTAGSFLGGKHLDAGLFEVIPVKESVQIEFDSPQMWHMDEVVSKSTKLEFAIRPQAIQVMTAG